MKCPIAGREERRGYDTTVVETLGSYTANTNKLLAVIDLSNDNSSKVGDFKYDATSKTSTDYTYDGNGNLVTDNKKKLAASAIII